MRRPEFIARQSGNPRGLIGRLIAGIMSRETRYENDKALALLDLKPGDQFIDVGTGHGAALKQAATTMRTGRIVGLDGSAVMVKLARKNNHRQIKRGLVATTHARSDAMPFENAEFNKALSVHTIYFWSNLKDHFAEILRVLVPGGTFVLGFRPGDDTAFRNAFPDSVYHFRPRTEVMEELEAAGFEILTVREQEEGERGHLIWALMQKRLAR